MAALRNRIAQLDAEFLAAQNAKEATLTPLQQGEVLTQRQKSSSDAAASAKEVQNAADAAVVAFDADARATKEHYLEHMRQLVAAQTVVEQKSVADRGALVTRLRKGTDVAHAKAADMKRLLSAAQSTQAQQSGAAQAAAQSLLEQQQAVAAAQLATQQQHLQQQEILKQQLAETQAKLNAQAAELTKQQAAVRPSAMQPAAVLPSPSMPEGKDAATAMYSLRASLLLLAEQDTPVVVSWGDLALGHLHWADVCRIVPHHVIDRSVKGIDAAAGPSPEAPVPRRVLELIRKQLDAIVSEWVRDNDTKVAVAQEKHSQSAWAQNVLDEAKRVQERKRPAESTAEAANTLAKICDAPASQLHSDFDAPAAPIDVDAVAPAGDDAA